MHNNLTTPEEDVHFAMKSSPLGTAGRGFLPNNAFELNAFGKPFIISSGYLDEYGSHHQKEWMSKPSSSNVITATDALIDLGIESSGDIQAHHFGNEFDYAWGQTTNRYGDNKMNFDRHVFYLKPKTFILFDEVEANQPETFKYHLHSPQEISAFKQERLIVLSKPSGMRISLVTPINLIMETQNKTIPPSFSMPEEQWHFTAAIPEPREKSYFISVFQPTPNTLLPKLEMKYISATTKGTRVQIYIFITDDHTISLTYNPTGGRFIGGYSGQYETDARLSMFALDTKDETQSYGFLSQATFFNLKDQEMFSAQNRTTRFLNQNETQEIMAAAEVEG